MNWTAAAQLARAACALSVASLLAGLAACGDRGNARQPAAAAGRAQPLRVAAQRLTGGTGQAWLTADGDLGDSNYCSARLKLPLAPEPAWTYSYSAAEVGPDPTQDLVHYGGLVAGSGGGSVVFVLDARSGQERSKADAFLRQAGGLNMRESFMGLMFSPRGCLTGLDENGRYYVWDWPLDRLEQPRVGPPHDGLRNGFVALDETVVGSNGDALAAMRLADVTQVAWEEQLGVQPRGVVALADGTVVGWTIHGLVSCNAPDGAERWRTDEGSRLQRVVLDPEGDRAYVALFTGVLVCRAMDTGRELWRYDWNGLVPPAEQAGLLEGLNALLQQGQFGNGPLESLILQAQLIGMAPQGVVLALQSGDVVLLDPASGKVRWHTRLHALADRGIVFRNGVLIHLRYHSLASNTRGIFTTLPFLLHVPEWAEIEDRAALEKFNIDALSNGSQSTQAPKRRVVYGRFAVLNLDDGKLVQYFVEDKPAGGSIIPVEDKLVVALEQEALLTLPESHRAPCKLAAYSWLEQGGG
jgi:outer membrane protein assembly factor BamB